MKLIKKKLNNWSDLKNSSLNKLFFVNDNKNPMKIKTTKELILMNSIHVSKGRTISQHLYNEGLNKESFKKQSEAFLQSLLKDEKGLIEITEHYPENDIQDIDIKADFIIIKTKDLDKIFNFKE